MFDNFESVVAPLENGGLVQSLLLLPIFFVFFNLNLIDQPVNYNESVSLY